MDFYYLPSSAACRSVLMTAKALGIELNKKYLDLMSGEQLKPEFIKLNPQHTIPTLVDHGFSVWESRAIMSYLVEKYGKNDALYPKCPGKKAIVNQRLYFDFGTLYTSFTGYYYPQFRKQPANPELYKKIENALELLDTFLKDSQYAAGDTLTIADFALLATLSSFYAINFDFSKYANINRWYELCKTTAPGWEENWEGCLEFKKFYDNAIKESA